MLRLLTERVADACRRLGCRDNAEICVGASGGTDSMLLLFLLHTLRDDIGVVPHAVHVHHGLRSAADADADFVRNWCSEHSVRCTVVEADVSTEVARTGDSIEAAARRLRYSALLESAVHTGSEIVATAHHADDQAETILHHILRGTGIRGLAGMAELTPMNSHGRKIQLIRPLLSVRRAEIEQAASEAGLAGCIDEMNFDRRFTRSVIRHEILPHLSESVPYRVPDSLRQLGRHAAELTSFMDDLASELLDRIVLERQADVVRLNRQPLSLSHPALQAHTLQLLWRLQQWPEQGMTADAWGTLRMLTEGELNRAHLPGRISATVDGNLMRLIRISESASDSVAPE